MSQLLTRICNVTALALLLVIWPAQGAVVHISTDMAPIPATYRGVDTLDSGVLYWGAEFSITSWEPWEINEIDGRVYFAFFYQPLGGKRIPLRTSFADRRWNKGGQHQTALFETTDGETGPFYIAARAVGAPDPGSWNTWLIEGVPGEFVEDPRIPCRMLDFCADLSTDFAPLDEVLANPHYEFTLVQGEIPEPGTLGLMTSGMLMLAVVRARRATS